MGSKSQVRSMQRGAQKRDRTMSQEPDYGKIAPRMRDEDRVHIGLTDAAAEKMASTLQEKIQGYARAGFRKPADVSRLLNKEAIRTAAGTEWNPRLVYFLLGRIFADSPRNLKVPQPTTTKLPDQNKFEQVRQKARKEIAKVSEKPKPERLPKMIKVRAPSEPVALTADEMAARMKALRDHFKH